MNSGQTIYLHTQDSQFRGDGFLDKFSPRRTGTVLLTVPKPAYRKVGHAQLYQTLGHGDTQSLPETYLSQHSPCHLGPTRLSSAPLLSERQVGSLYIRRL